jgi:xylose isomerase
MMKPVPVSEQQALVERLSSPCGGACSPETRRKYFISGPQWAASYCGQAILRENRTHGLKGVC